MQCWWQTVSNWDTSSLTFSLKSSFRQGLCSYTLYFPVSNQVMIQNLWTLIFFPDRLQCLFSFIPNVLALEHFGAALFCHMFWLCSFWSLGDRLSAFWSQMIDNIKKISEKQLWKVSMSFFSYFFWVYWGHVQVNRLHLYKEIKS